MKGPATRREARLPPGKGDGGFTLVEIMLALAVGAIVIVGMYQAFNTLHKWWIADNVRSDMRQNARAGMETLTRDIEMAGYQTTNYGDVNKTGIAITLASAHEIEMDQQRPDSATIKNANPVFEPRLVYYHLATDLKTGRQNLYRQIRTQTGQSTPDELVAENVSDFTLAYQDKNNNPVDCLFTTSNNPNYPLNNSQYTFNVARPGDADYCRVPVSPCTTRVPCNSGLSPDPLKNIRRIQVTLTTIPARGVPFGPTPRPFTLTAVVFPRNLEAADEVSADTTPPKVPTNLAVIDKRSCTGKLRVMWKANMEQDLAGYILFYGSTDYVKVPVGALVDKNNPEVTLNPHDLLITKNADRARAPSPPAPNPYANTYPIQILAYDSSGNHSGKSAAVTGDPSPDETAFVVVAGVAVNASDTTVNPLKPSPPTGLTVVPGSAEGELDISWQAPADGSATVGYRLYRSTVAFTEGGHIDGSLQIARETTLTAQLADPAGTWTDKHLEGCRTYYYAVASVNCDETLIEGSPLVAGYHYNGSNAGDYAVASGTPQDTTPPPAPSLAGAQAGEKRILITLTNPMEEASPDFDRTEIFWNKSTTALPADPPHLNGTAVVNGTRIPESDSGNPGIFKNLRSQTIVFDNEAVGSPAQPLVDGATYGFLAVSYDRCGNVSAAPPLAVEILGSSACSDDPPGPPPAATQGRITTCQPDSVVLGWTRATVKDLARFRIFRAGPDGVAVPLTDGPGTLTFWTDTDSLVAGAQYTYWVTANDCVYEKYLLDSLLPWPYTNPPYPPYPSTPPFEDPLPSYPGNTLKLGPVYPGGGLRRYDSPSTVPGQFVTTLSDNMVADQPSTYTYHNNVRFWLQNTSQSPVRIKKMAVTWNNPNVVLERVVSGSGATERTVVAGGAASGVEFNINIDKSATTHPTDIAGGTSAAVPLLLRFTTPAGAVNHLTDMRSERLGISLWGWNLSFDYLECPNPTSVTIDVPRGPKLEFFSQSAPGRDGIDSYEVVGPSGTARDTDIKVSTGVGVNVYGTALDFSRELLGVNQGFDILKVVTTSAVAAVLPAIPVMPAGSHLDRSLETIGGDRYAICSTCPSSPVSAKLLPRDTSNANKVHWYYALAVDKTANWDRVPDPDNGNYAYFQTEFNVCSFRPKAPVLALDPSSTSTAAILTWTAPTMYNDNITAIVVADVLRYDLYVKSPSGSWPTSPDFPDLSGLSYTHSTAGAYHYMVRAKNSCVPETGMNPGVSDDSNVVIR